MHVWSFAHKKARQGEWELVARDREHFRFRINRVEKIIELYFIKYLILHKQLLKNE